MNLIKYQHAILAVVSLIGIIVLQVLGKGNADIYALLGALTGYGTHAMGEVQKGDDKNG